MLRCRKLRATLLVLQIVGLVGQGYIRSPEKRGATNTRTELQELYSRSKAWKSAYRLQPAAACSKRAAQGTRSANLCGSLANTDADFHAQLMLATSPPVYSSTNLSQAGPARLVAAASNQGQCHSCVAFAVRAAAQTAMAARLQVDVEDCSISVHALFYNCQAAGPPCSCDSGWTLPEALKQLVEQGRKMPTEYCLPYKPDYTSELYSKSQLCVNNLLCSTPNKFAGQGNFSYTKGIASAWVAQRHIRQHGSVVTSFDVYSDFQAFFKEPSNADKVYRPGAGAKFKFGHAVVLVGYNNDQGYWLAQNSQGPEWGNGGLFKVAMGVCSVLDEAFGLMWDADEGSETALQLPTLNAAPATPGCVRYTARPGDYLSRVAWLAGIPLEQFMLDNTPVVKDLDAPIAGLQLLLCGPAKAATWILANEGIWGTWRSQVLCPPGSFVHGWATRVEARQTPGWRDPGSDDTALNGVKIGCTPKAGGNYMIPDHPSDTLGYWGSLSGDVYCPSGGHVTGVRIRLEPQQGLGDDTAMNDVEGYCSRGGDISTPNSRGWGDWTSIISCPAGQAVCGIQPRIEDQQGPGGDDTAMNGLRLRCCPY